MIVLPHEIEKILQRSFEAKLAFNLFHLGLNPGYLGNTQLVNFICRKRQGCHGSETNVIVLLAIGKRPGTLRLCRYIGPIENQPGQNLIVGRFEIGEQGAPGLPL